MPDLFVIAEAEEVQKFDKKIWSVWLFSEKLHSICKIYLTVVSMAKCLIKNCTTRFRSINILL